MVFLDRCDFLTDMSKKFHLNICANVFTAAEPFLDKLLLRNFYFFIAKLMNYDLWIIQTENVAEKSFSWY